jgi:hypothetical protein
MKRSDAALLAHQRTFTEQGCGEPNDVSQHSLDDSTPKRCANGHTVPQPVARADFEKLRTSGPAQPVAAMLPQRSDRQLSNTPA